MKHLSIRAKITLWFTAILAAVAALAVVAVLSISASVMQKTVRDNLVVMVAGNIDEIEFFPTLQGTEYDNDADIYIEYKGGYLEVDDDYLDLVNGISTSLYLENGVLLYGENPISKESMAYPFADDTIQRISVEGIRYYIYDRMLTQPGLEGLWLRGIVSEEQGKGQLSDIARFSLYLLPLLLLLAAFGGYFIAGVTLRPIKKIEAAAKQIGKGQDLKKRIELAPGTDELHRLAATFNEMFARLDASFESERQFTSDVSHELRTPMSVILAQCEFTLEQAREPEEYEAALQTIQRQGEKVSALVENMLRFVRLEQKADIFPMERLDFSSLVSSVSEDMALLKEQGITLDFETEQNVYVRGNRELLARLLTNLIGNAYRYGRENGSIQVKLDTTASHAVLSVCDNGIGIAPEQQEKIFHRFYQVDPARAGKGAGLGLAMVREIAAFHGGEVCLESEAGKGSKFTFTLEKELGKEKS